MGILKALSALSHPHNLEELQVKRTEEYMLRQTRQAMYVQRNIEVRSRNHCCRGKAINITYFECVSVALVIQHASACAVFYCHLWPVWLYHTFTDYLIKGTIFGRKCY
jgi:hypothetical protein